MRVLYLTPTGVFSGGERVTLSIAGEMRLRGHETVYCGLEGRSAAMWRLRGCPFLRCRALRRRLCAGRSRSVRRTLSIPWIFAPPPMLR